MRRIYRYILYMYVSKQSIQSDPYKQMPLEYLGVQISIAVASILAALKPSVNLTTTFPYRLQ